MGVAEKITEIIVEQLGVKPEEVVPEASFVDDLGADSLDTVELVMAFEEEFGAEIPDASSCENGLQRLHVTLLKRSGGGIQERCDCGRPLERPAFFDSLLRRNQLMNSAV